jgi:regulator of cell morphogenesis and NO signaling
MDLTSQNQVSQPRISDYFQADHDRLDELFKDFQKFKRTDYARAKDCFVQFKFGLQRHIVWEEEVLFPLFENKSGLHDYGPTVVMRSEHQQIGKCLEDIHKKVQKSNPESDREEEALIDILKLHNQKEELILYPAIDRMITREESELAFVQMRNIPESRYETCCSHAVGA